MSDISEKVSKLVAVEVMKAHGGGLYLAYAVDWELMPFLQERINELNAIDAYCHNLVCTRNRIFVNEPMPNCNPSRVIEWLLIKATPLQRSLAALATVGYDIEPLLTEAGYPRLPRENK